MARRKINKNHVLLAFIAIFLIIGLGIGFFIRKSLFTPKNCFKLNGDSVIKINNLNDYKESGCTYIKNDKDLSNTVTITKPNFNGVGTYIVKYEVDGMIIERIVIIHE